MKTILIEVHIDAKPHQSIDELRLIAADQAAFLKRMEKRLRRRAQGIKSATERGARSSREGRSRGGR